MTSTTKQTAKLCSVKPDRCHGMHYKSLAFSRGSDIIRWLKTLKATFTYCQAHPLPHLFILWVFQANYYQFVPHWRSVVFSFQIQNVSTFFIILFGCLVKFIWLFVPNFCRKTGKIGKKFIKVFVNFRQNYAEQSLPALRHKKMS